MTDSEKSRPPGLQRLPTTDSSLAAIPAKIWDLPTRLFHWLLVFAVIIATKTGFFGPANSLDWHVWSGYGIGALIVFRLIWGLFGSEFSRLDRLWAALRNLPEHARGLLSLRPKHYLGHNPAGSLMIIGLITVLLAIVVSGVMVLGGVEKQGVLAGVTSYALGHLAKGGHQLLAYLLMVMVLGHLLGVATEIVLLRVPLVRGMITGWLPVAADAAPPAERNTWRQPKPLLALIGTAFAAIAIAVPMLPLTTLPARGLPAPVPAGSTYANDCGECHWSFHPSLLPRASWKLIMASLDDHFGGVATLTPKAAAEIAAYLDANAAETVDTEPANRFREVAAEAPMRITKTRFWRRTHDNIGDETFSSKAVRSKTNCAACHRDALTGRFDDQAIDIPHQLPTGETP